MINIELELNEVNLLLGALGKQPYEVSSELIHKIRAQALPQVQSQSPKSPEITEVSE